MARVSPCGPVAFVQSSSPVRPLVLMGLLKSHTCTWKLTILTFDWWAWKQPHGKLIFFYEGMIIVSKVFKFLNDFDIFHSCDVLFSSNMSRIMLSQTFLEHARCERCASGNYFKSLQVFFPEWSESMKIFWIFCNCLLKLQLVVDILAYDMRMCIQTCFANTFLLCLETYMYCTFRCAVHCVHVHVNLFIQHEVKK